MPREPVEKSKYLGVVVDDSLKWRDQFSNVQRKVYAGIACINRAKDGLNINERTGLYNAFVKPHLDYCASIWSAATKELRRRMGAVQREALKAMLDYPLRPRNEVLYASCKVTEVEESWQKQDAMWLFRIVSNDPSVPTYLKETIKFTDDAYDLRTSRKIEYNCRTKIGETTFASRPKRLFESLPKSIWTCENLDIFKYKLSEL